VKRLHLSDWGVRGIALASLTLAGAAYLALREGLRLHVWAALVLGESRVARIRALGHELAFPSWVRFTLPDALWQFALCLTIFRIWWGARWTFAKLAWCALPSTLGIAIELAQRAHWIEGTYDPADVVASIAAVALAAAANTLLAPPPSKQPVTRGTTIAVITAVSAVTATAACAGPAPATGHLNVTPAIQASQRSDSGVASTPASNPAAPPTAPASSSPTPPPAATTSSSPVPPSSASTGQLPPLPPLPPPDPTDTGRDSTPVASPPQSSSCYASLVLSGDATQDIALLGDACGRRLGLVPLGAPIVNRQAEADPEQRFAVHLLPGCYRLFATADSSVTDLKLRLADAAGDIITQSEGTNHAVLDPAAPFCISRGGEHGLYVAVMKGHGRYALQMWKVPPQQGTRP
jgi:hypothetical protein